jgi:hypothetical protein
VVRGTPDDPMSRDEVLDKARDLIAPVLGADRCAQVLDLLCRIETVADAGELAALLRG